MGSVISSVGGTLGGIAGLAGGVGQNGFVQGIPQQNLTPQITSANLGVQTNMDSQRALAGQLLNQSQGGGPNLANAQLANSTGTNVANQAALMASQRGTGSNAGLIARQAAQQGGALQQQAAGQAAVNRASQVLNSQGQLANVYGQIGNEAGQNLGIQQNALATQNSQLLQGQGINAGIAQQNSQTKMGQLAAIGGGAASGGGSKSSGGEEEEEEDDAEGGMAGRNLSTNSYSSQLHTHLQSISDIYHPHMSQTAEPKQFNQEYAEGGKVKAMVSPGEKFLKPKDVKKVVEGKAKPMEVGETIPGKPKVSGAKNSYANDIVPKKLEIGGIVLPRSVTKSKDPGKSASEFVMAIINKQKKGAK